MESNESYQPNYPRVIYLVRDGRDIAVSYYNFYQTIKGYSGTFEEFLRLLLNGETAYGSWHGHVRSWVFRRQTNPYILVQYEKLHEEPFAILRNVAKFLELDVADNQIASSLSKCTFQRLKEDIRNNTSLYGRGYQGGVKGGPGAWKEMFTEELLCLFWEEAGSIMERLGYSRASELIVGSKEA